MSGLWRTLSGHRSSIIVHDSSYKAMFKQFISKMPGADVYLVTSFLIFLVFFILVGLYLFFIDRKYVDHISRLPLDDSLDA